MKLILGDTSTRLPQHEAIIGRLISSKIASSLQAGDSSLWGPDAEPEASIRLGWVAHPELMIPLVESLETLRDQFRESGVTRVLLCGMGGSSLAPEVMARVSGVELDILDSTHPDHVRDLIDRDLSDTLTVVSSKSGTTVETATARAAVSEIYRDQGIDPRERVIIVTDPGSPLHLESEQAGHRVFLADSNVGGRYSALTAFGLVPATLAGVDCREILNQASAVWASCGEDSAENPAIQLAAALSDPERDQVVLGASRACPGLGEWVEQLVAESTGKEGRGILPIASESTEPAELQLAAVDQVLWTSGRESVSPQWDVRVEADLGAAFLLWEYATAMVGVIREINPFDQPDVESAKVAARSLLENRPERGKPVIDSSGLRCWVGGFETSERTLPELWQALVAVLGPSGYLSIQLYGNRLALGSLEQWRNALVEQLRRPVTMGFGPRFLHSTGQFHKGGTPDGVFVQVEVEPRQDRSIPGYPYSFGTLIDAQSWGDRNVLVERGRPVLTVRITQDGWSDILDQFVDQAL